MVYQCKWYILVSTLDKVIPIPSQAVDRQSEEDERRTRLIFL